MPSPRPLAHPALPHPKAARLSLLTLPFGSCSFGLAAALILAIPWKESFSITQLAAKPSACQLCLLTCVAGVPQQHTPAPARPGLPVPAFCTPMPHTRLPSTPWHVSSRRSRIPSCHGWSGCPGPATPAQLHGHPFGFCLVRSRRARHKRTPVLFDLEIPPPRPPGVCDSSPSLTPTGNGATPHAAGDPTAVGVQRMGRVGLVRHAPAGCTRVGKVGARVGGQPGLRIGCARGRGSRVPRARCAFRCARRVRVRGARAVLSFRSGSACGAFFVHSGEGACARGCGTHKRGVFACAWNC